MAKQLTTEDLQKIMVDEITGRKPRIEGPEADKFRKDLQTDIKLAKKKGWDLVIPTENEVDGVE